MGLVINRIPYARSTAKKNSFEFILIEIDIYVLTELQFVQLLSHFSNVLNDLQRTVHLTGLNCLCLIRSERIFYQYPFQILELDFLKSQSSERTKSLLEQSFLV